MNEIDQNSALPRPKGLFRDYFETIVTCVIFVVFSRAFVFQQSKIPTGSMIPTLLIGDYIMVNKYVYSSTASVLEEKLFPVGGIKRGDVIVFKYPLEPEKDYIKRVIGLPEETIEVRNCTVYINGTPLEEPYKQHVNRFNCRWDYYPPTRIPENSYFAMGDNRDESRDSRVWGFVPRKNIKGRALLIWWSYEEKPGTWRQTGLRARAKSIVEKTTHFLTRSRWNRSFKMIR
ncbi:MAG: signal peptidase I [Acidobacteria bacterium]|nr:signal peptidase I [Acidobacteriota bacterium]